jgi:hypothetical protein
MFYAIITTISIAYCCKDQIWCQHMRDFVPDRSSCMSLRGMCLVVVLICHMLALQGYALGLVHGAACDAGSFVGKERPMLLPQL